jgi:hypothetical protein
MPWSKAMCAALRLRKPRPTSPPRIAKTLAGGPAVDPLVCDLFANVQLRPENKVDFERVAEIGDLGFSEFCGGCGFRWSYSWSSPAADSP